jgi:hypothetical protein
MSGPLASEAPGVEVCKPQLHRGEVEAGISPQAVKTAISGDDLCRLMLKFPVRREARVAFTVVTDLPPITLVRGWTTGPRVAQLPL